MKSVNSLNVVQVLLLVLLSTSMCVTTTLAFTSSPIDHPTKIRTTTSSSSSSCLMMSNNSNTGSSSSSSSSSTTITILSRRDVFQKSAAAATLLGFFLANPQQAIAATATSASSEDTNNNTKTSLETYLYRIIRVREATQQERRLISTGKFKDVQRANVKLAVKFMIQNYRLADSVVGAAAYVPGGSGSSMKATDVGLSAVQNLQTILEYFDSQDVENIKVGSSGSMAGKEDLVVKGLQATQAKIDEFLAFFPADTVSKVKAIVQEENELNVKEFDKSLGDILNLPPPS